MPFDVHVNWRGVRSDPVFELEIGGRRSDSTWRIRRYSFFVSWREDFRGVDVTERLTRAFALALCTTAAGRRYVLIQVGDWVTRPGWST